MNNINTVRYRVQQLYHKHPHIHLNASITKPKTVLRNQPATITAIYPHIFRIETQENGICRSYTLQYADVCTQKIQILELSETL